MRKWVNDPDVVDNLDDIFLAPHTLETTQVFLDSVLKGGSQNSYHFVIADKDTEDYIGQVDLVNIDWKNGSAEMGIVIGEAVNRGKGIGHEAIQLIQDFAFNRINMNRLQIKVYAFNTKAIRCYRKSGFQEEGRLRQSLYRHGKYHDIILLSVLKSEFDSRMQERPII